MDKQDAVRELTRRGIIVTPEILKRIESEGQEAVSGLLLTKQRERPPRPKLSVKLRKTERLSRMSPADFTSYYNSRYQGLRDVLLRKMDAVSINKAVAGLPGASVIGMVKEKTTQGFVLEDSTGEIPVVSKDAVGADDVVGVRGTVREGRLFQSELVWPDVPLGNGARFVPGMSLLLTTFLDEALLGTLRDFSLVFVPERPSAGLPEEEGQRLITDLPNPCAATINKEGVEFNVLIYRPGREVSSGEAIGFLRRRHLAPERSQIFSKTDPYVIEPVPDLFWILSDTQERHIERYKGVTAIITRKQDAVKYDAETGKAYFAYD